MKPFSVGESKNRVDGKKQKRQIDERHKIAAGNDGNSLFTFWAYDHSQHMTEPFAVGKKSNRYNVMQGDTLSGGWEHLFTFWAFNPDKGTPEDILVIDDVRPYTKLEQKRRSYPCSNI